MSENEPEPRVGQFLFYDTEDGTTRIHLWAEHNTVWIHQKAIADLFETTVANVNTHISNIIADSEVQRDSVIKDYLITASDGKQYRTKHYNLDTLLAIGCRVRSPRGVQFRRWATETLREDLVKGFVLNDESNPLNPPAISTTSSKTSKSWTLRKKSAKMNSRFHCFGELGSQFAESLRWEKSIKSNREALGYA